MLRHIDEIEPGKIAAGLKFGQRALRYFGSEALQEVSAGGKILVDQKILAVLLGDTFGSWRVIEPRLNALTMTPLPFCIR